VNRKARRLLLLAVCLAVLAAVALERGRRRGAETAAFPEQQGRLRVAGLAAPVEILRDDRGVPHIQAESEPDAWFGLGFAHAQDRLAQMQWLVRLARGRSAEWVGAAGVPADRWARTLDLAGVAEREAAGLDAATRACLEAYARGVNARIERVRSGRAALPFALRELAVRELEDWRPADSLAVQKQHAWALSGSVEASLALDDLQATLGAAAARPFFPSPPRGGGERPAAEGRVTALRWRDPLRRAAGLEGRSAGSSAWVLGGAHSQSGRPLLAADAHLAPTQPPLYYLAHLRGGALDVAGASVPGVPAFWTGHNRRVAWASTAARAAVVDLYNEKLHASGERYHDGRGWQPLALREESIAVRDAPPVTVSVRSTRHGPLLDGVLSDGRDPLALAWTGHLGLGAESLAALHGVARAGSADELLAALARFADPPVAVVYADAEGAAGLQVAGWLPRRPLAAGLVPVEGRARWYDWEGRIPFDQLPRRRLEGGRGWAVAADNALHAESGAEEGEWLWRTGARAERIDSRLREAVSRGPVSLREMAALLGDVREPRAQVVIEAALSLAGDDPLGAEASEVAELLRGWDGETTPESVGAAAYHVFLASLTEALFRDRMGEGLLQRWLSVPQVDPAGVVGGIVLRAAAGGEPGGWSDAERVGAAVRASLRDAWFRLSYGLGGSRSKWRWGRLHQLSFRPFVPGIERGGAGPFELGGSASTVSSGDYAPAGPFDVRIASTFRFAADTAALDHSLAALAPGQSEHPNHPHERDGLPAWLEGRASVLPIGNVLVEEAGVARLLLEPAP
jgi:penicillin amidase